MDGQEGEAPWHNISCDAGCQYTTSDEASIGRYLAALPASMQSRYDMACIENSANAFCRITMKSNPAKGGYLMVLLVSGRPTPASLTRLSR